jgi:hypothetical protein
VKAPFDTVVIEDAFERGNGDTIVDVFTDARTASGFEGDLVVLGLAQRRAVALKPDEARAIGQALIAAADHIQS